VRSDLFILDISIIYLLSESIQFSVSLLRDDVIKLLLPVFADPRSSMEVLGVTALAAGLISVGSCNLDVTSTILQTLIEKSESDLKVSNRSTFQIV
jgi:hypothetical protein